MITLTEEQLKEIADLLVSGMIAYYNIKTNEIESVIDFDSWESIDDEPWQDVLDKIEENSEDYISFEKMSSNQSFSMMERFAESVDNTKLQNRLLSALEKAHPFRNFKWEIDNAGDYRKDWFTFRDQSYVEWVKEQLESYNGFPDDDE